ncbi:MAG: VacJ family lipoprotein [Acetobacteraceae bacterium]|nr:VacJ family lipoprotein [Acetobacteraceae bacterium]
MPRCVDIWDISLSDAVGLGLPVVNLVFKDKLRVVTYFSPKRASVVPAFVLAVFLAVGLTGCATPPPASDAAATADFQEINDPLEPTNRVMYQIHSGIDTVVMRPLAQGYRAVIPQLVREGVHNLLTNMATPVIMANDMIQGKPVRAEDSFMRFLINTVFGLGGLIDVAKEWGWQHHDNDFGTTLALWGVDEGPFLFLPILGPSNPRDLVGFGANIATDPWTWVVSGTDKTLFHWSRRGLSALDGRERVLDGVDSIQKIALDPYATFRSLYRQRRAARVQEVRDDKRVREPN